MFNKKYGNFLTVLLVIALIAIIVLLGYFVYDVVSRHNSNKSAEEAVDAFQQQFIGMQNSNSNTGNYDGDLNNIDNLYNTNQNIDGNYIDSNENNSSEGNSNENNGNGNNSETPNNQNGNSGTNSNGGTTTTNKNKNNNKTNNYVSKNKYEGYTMLGTIEIPKIKVKTPILKELSVSALNKAVCLIYGNLNEEDSNAVIIGHNNRNGTYFSNLKKLKSGDTITITDYTGQKITYTVYSIFQATPDDTSFYQRETNGLREITLSTCTDSDDTKRIIVLAKES